MAESDATLASIGEDLKLAAEHSVVQALLYGIYFVVQAATVYILAFRSPTSMSLAIKFLLSMTLIVFLSTSLEFARGFASLVVNINVLLVGAGSSPSDLFSDRKHQLSAVLRPVTIMSCWTSTINFLCGDLIVAWRAYALCSQYRFVLFRLSLLFIAFCDTALALCSGIVLTRSFVVHDLNTMLGLVGEERRADFAINSASNYFSLITNAYATALIGICAWRHAATMARFGFAGSTVRSSAVRVLILLVETGFAFCSIQLVYCVLINVAESPDLFNVFIFYIAALYPSFIMIILRYQRSVIDNSQSSVFFGSVDIEFDRPKSGCTTQVEDKDKDRTPVTRNRISITIPRLSRDGSTRDSVLAHDGREKES